MAFYDVESILWSVEISETSERTRQDLEYFKIALQKSRAKAEKYKKMYIDQKRVNEQRMRKLVEGDSAMELMKEDELEVYTFIISLSE